MQVTSNHETTQPQAPAQRHATERPHLTLPPCSGVYQIENRANGKVYIGSSLNMQRRVQHHFHQLRTGKHSSRYLQRAFTARPQDFGCVALEVLPEADTATLLEAEQRWLNALTPTLAAKGYNLHPTAASTVVLRQDAEAMARIRPQLQARRRGVRTPEGAEQARVALVERWQREGEKDYFAEIIADQWADPELRAKREEGMARHKAEPGALEAMRARVEAARQSDRWRSSTEDWWRKQRADVAARFPTAEALNAWIETEYVAGRSIRSIAVEIGMSHNAASWRLRRRGVVATPRGLGRHSILKSATRLAQKGINDMAEFDDVVGTLFDEGHTVNRLRLAYGVSSEAIRTSLRRTGRIDAYFARCQARRTGR